MPGAAVSVAVADRSVAATVGPALAALPAAAAGADAVVLEAQGLGVGELLARLDELVIRACNETHAVLHAGAVVRNRVAVLLPGSSGSGKSTLTAALVQAGWGLLSDELAPIAGGIVAPYPIAPRLRSGSWRLLGLRPPEGISLRWPVPINLLDGAPAPATPVAAVVLLDRDGRPGVVTATRAEALEVLCQSCFNLDAAGLPVWQRLVELISSAAAVRLGYGAPAEGAAALTAWADREV